ncbi:MAG: hypothetical protein CMP23_10645 [Rickettsiales bacterium]|nr:hypothetical protein [Rickettsiales bacterium]
MTASLPSLDETQQTLDKGLVCYALGQRDDAIRLWNEALELSPGDARALDYLQSVGALAPSDLEPGVDLRPDGPEDGVGLSTIDRAAESLVSPFRPEPEEVDAADGGVTDIGADTMVADVDILLGDAQANKDSGDFEVALKNCEEALRKEPDHAEANELAEELRQELNAIYLKELEPLDRVPFLRAADSSILELSLDPVGGFLISQIDGEITVDELLTILSTFDQFRVLSSLHYFLVNEIIELR